MVAFRKIIEDHHACDVMILIFIGQGTRTVPVRDTWDNYEQGEM
jgi:hypothetical protein